MKHVGHSPGDDCVHRGGQRHCNLAIVLSSSQCITCGKCMFQEAVHRRPGWGSEPQEDHRIPLKQSELQAGGGPRTVQCRQGTLKKQSWML